MKSNIATAAAGLLLLLTSPTLAAEPADHAKATTEKARATFRQGVRLFNEGSFEAALATFGKAYQLSPNYRLFFNIAQTYLELHDYVNAARTLDQYLQQGGSEIGPERRAQVAELKHKSEEQIAYLDVACDLAGADIRVDDISVGVAPLMSLVPVNAGPRRITAVKPGYAVAAAMVTAVGSERGKVTLKTAGPVPAQAGGAPTVAVLDGSVAAAPSRTGLITSTVVTGGLALATGVFAILALRAGTDFNGELDQVPNTKDNVDSARDKMNTYAHLTDALGAATLVSAGVLVYFLLTDNGPAKPAKTRSSLVLAPSAGGMLLQGRW